MMKPKKHTVTFEEYQKITSNTFGNKKKHTIFYYSQWFWYAIGFIGLVISAFYVNRPEFISMVCLSSLCSIVGFIQDYFDHKIVYHNG
jgi:hypothetical protein